LDKICNIGGGRGISAGQGERTVTIIATTTIERRYYGNYTQIHRTSE